MPAGGGTGARAEVVGLAGERQSGAFGQGGAGRQAYTRMQCPGGWEREQEQRRCCRSARRALPAGAVRRERYVPELDR